MGKRSATHETLAQLQRQSLSYFLHEANPRTGLIADRTEQGSPASISATGLALTLYPVAVERGLLSAAEAQRRTLATLRFFLASPQNNSPTATGYNGFYYHFLDMKTGARAGQSELSTIDSAMLFGGMLVAAAWFNDDRPEHREIRDLANQLFARANWQWAQNRSLTVCHGWTPETGFLPYRWKGYSEALLLYILGLGAPQFQLPAASYNAWTRSYVWKTVYDQEYLYAGPLFIHQFSHLWIDFRGIQDAFMRGKRIDYFENSRRATYAQRQYAIHNPLKWDGYGENCWGISASEGPGPGVRRLKGRSRRFFGYIARGIPFGPDDGTLSPWAAVASLPFAPELVMPLLRRFDELKLRESNRYGFKPTFNMTFPARGRIWTSPHHVGLNQGPIALMIENARSGLIWRLMRQQPYIIAGLRRCGFTGGWLPAK